MFRARFILAAVALIVVFSLSCSYRYTIAFHLEDKFPPKRRTYQMTDNLPERFGPWVVQVYVWSAIDSKDREKIKANEFTCGLAFRLPEDTIAWQWANSEGAPYSLDSLFVNDTSANIISVDSVSFYFEPSGGKKSLATEAQGHRSFYCGFVHIPESVDSLTVRFTTRLVSPDGIEIMRREFAPRFYRWTYRWNDWFPLE